MGMKLRSTLVTVMQVQKAFIIRSINKLIEDKGLNLSSEQVYEEVLEQFKTGDYPEEIDAVKDKKYKADTTALDWVFTEIKIFLDMKKRDLENWGSASGL